MKGEGIETWVTRMVEKEARFDGGPIRLRGICSARISICTIKDKKDKKDKCINIASYRIAGLSRLPLPADGCGMACQAWSRVVLVLTASLQTTCSGHCGLTLPHGTDCSEADVFPEAVKARQTHNAL